MSGGVGRAPGACVQRVCREEEGDRGRRGENEAGGGGLPCRPHQGNGALGPLELQFSM